MESPQCSAWNYTMHPLWSELVLTMCCPTVSEMKCVYTCSKWLHANVEWEANTDRGDKQRDAVLFKSGDDETWVSWCCIQLFTWKVTIVVPWKRRAREGVIPFLNLAQLANHTMKWVWVSIRQCQKCPFTAPPNLLLERCVCQSPVVLYRIIASSLYVSILYIGSLQGLMRVYERESTEDHVCMIF